jgi:hypothetical protein
VFDLVQPSWSGGRAVDERGLARADEADRRVSSQSRRWGARGEMLLKCDRANPEPAEKAFQTAIAVAKQQSTRSFELRASLSLANLYQSTVRPADAHAVLAPRRLCANAGNAGNRRGEGAT